jgi:hypothetical protein
LNDNEKNINVGAQIFADNYRTSAKDFSCGTLSESYIGWEAALRGYNGWGCTGNDNYVEEVKAKYLELIDLYDAIKVTSEEEEEETTTLNLARKNILTAVEELTGAPFIKYNQLNSTQRAEINKDQTIWTWKGIQIIRDYDNSGSTVPNCFDSAIHLYDQAGVTFSGFKYCLNDEIVDVDKDGCNKDTDILKEEIEAGDILSIRYANTIHNVIFVKWINEATGEAEIFDWIGTTDSSKFPSSWTGDLRAFRVYTVNLKFDEKSVDYTVYAIGTPILL